MKVLQERHCHIKRGAVGADRLSRFAFVTLDECASGEFGSFEGSRLEKSECGTLHQEPADIRFGFARAELVDVDSRHALCSLDEDVHGMKVAMSRHTAAHVAG